MYAVFTLDYGEVGKMVKVGIFQLISDNFRVLADMLADIFICENFPRLQ